MGKYILIIRERVLLSDLSTVTLPIEMSFTNLTDLGFFILPKHLSYVELFSSRSYYCLVLLFIVISSCLRGVMLSWGFKIICYMKSLHIFFIVSSTASVSVSSTLLSFSGSILVISFKL